ncbi:MAG TPA: hypothetical protein P5205_10665 [Candidatus Paceibacterota bacterium]|nr:hypothetical protein [Verrucomicrobiota bacterium]HSA10818.1 hypothetical protein [Candidatus Paceibacterota bacterium]
MNPDKDKKLAELSRRNPFWICFIIFLLLAADYGFRFAGLISQREQLNRAALLQAQNADALAQAQEIERRLEALSLDLLQIATTNAAAKDIVQQFNMKWTPGPTASLPAPTAAGKQK